MLNLHRSEVAQFERTLTARGAIVAEVDRELRYLWIQGPPLDVRASEVIGKTDLQLASDGDALPLMDLKKRAFSEGRPVSRELRFRRPDGEWRCNVFAYPILEADGSVRALLTAGFTAAARERRAAEDARC